MLCVNAPIPAVKEDFADNHRIIPIYFLPMHLFIKLKPHIDDSKENYKDKTYDCKKVI